MTKGSRLPTIDLISPSSNSRPEHDGYCKKDVLSNFKDIDIPRRILVLLLIELATYTSKKERGGAGQS